MGVTDLKPGPQRIGAGPLKWIPLWPVYGLEERRRIHKRLQGEAATTGAGLSRIIIVRDAPTVSARPAATAGA